MYQKKNVNISFSKAKTKSCLSLHYNSDNSYLFVNGKKYVSLKFVIKILAFHFDFFKKHI